LIPCANGARLAADNSLDRVRMRAIEAGRCVKHVHVVAFLSVFAVGAGASAQPSTSSASPSVAAALGDPNKCVAVVEQFGDVGFRISDAQVIADAALTELKKRLGNEGAVYEGIPASLEHMSKLVGPEASPQTAQIEYYKKAIAHAKYKVRPRFGVKGKKHWITLSCRGVKNAPADVLDNKRFEGKSFADARDKMLAALPTWCPVLDSSLREYGGPAGATENASTTTAAGKQAEPGKAEPPPPWARKQKPPAKFQAPPPRE
jgi:hypothetical protein